MSVRVYNSPDIDKLSTYEVFKSSSANKERNFSEKYEVYYLGRDGLNLSKDYSYEYNYDTPYKKASKSYSNIIKFLAFMSLFLTLLLGFFAALVALGGLHFIIGLSIVFLTAVLMYSVNLNPLDKKTYKKLGIIS